MWKMSLLLPLTCLVPVRLMTHDSWGSHVPTPFLHFALVMLRIEKSVSQRSVDSTGEEPYSHFREYMIFVFNFYTKLKSDTICSKFTFHPSTILVLTKYSIELRLNLNCPLIKDMDSKSMNCLHKVFTWWNFNTYFRIWEVFSDNFSHMCGIARLPLHWESLLRYGTCPNACTLLYVMCTFLPNFWGKNKNVHYTWVARP